MTIPAWRPQATRQGPCKIRKVLRPRAWLLTRTCGRKRRRARDFPRLARLETSHAVPASHELSRLPALSVLRKTVCQIFMGKHAYSANSAFRHRRCVLRLRQEWPHLQAGRWFCNGFNSHDLIERRRLQVPIGAVAAVRAFWQLNKQLKLAEEDPSDAWSKAAQQAAQQMRACGPGAAAPSAASGPLHVLAPEKRKLLALETIAEAARLWTVSSESSSLILLILVANLVSSN